MIIVPVKGRECQISSYNHCLQEFGRSSKWIAFIDADEVLFPRKNDDIRILLTDYEGHGGLGVHWVEYGSSGHLTRPAAGQIDNYFQRFPLQYPKNMHIKSIVQPEKVEGAVNPHQFRYKKPWCCVDENYLPLLESWGPFTNEKIQLNHYYYRSQQDFCQKIQRGRADRIDEEGKRKLAQFFPQTGEATIDDNSLSVFFQKISSGRYDYISRLIPANDKNKEKEKNALLELIMSMISKNKTHLALEALKAAKAGLVDEYTVKYLLISIFQKEGKISESQNILYELLTRYSDPHLFLDLAHNMLRLNNTAHAGNMLAFVQWRYSRDIQDAPDLGSRLESLFSQLKSLKN